MNSWVSSFFIACGIIFCVICFVFIWFVLTELANRLKEHFNKTLTISQKTQILRIIDIIKLIIKAIMILLFTTLIAHTLITNFDWR